jgi:thiamine monophosphate synthase
VIVGISAGGDLAAWVASLSAWSAILLREDELPALPLDPRRTILHERARGARERCRDEGFLLHVRSDTPSPDLPFTASAHTEAEVDARLAAGARWVFWSPLHAPTSKPGDTRPPLGEARFLAHAAGRPVLALGGVTPGTLGRLLKAGAAGAAVLGGIPVHGPVAYAAARDAAYGIGQQRP